MGPIGAARVGFKDGDFILNPTKEEMETSALDLVVAGTKDAVLMVESEAKELSEEQMLGAVTFGQDNFSQVIDAIIRIYPILRIKLAQLSKMIYQKPIRKQINKKELKRLQK